jgi:hypothetical protein
MQTSSTSLALSERHQAGATGKVGRAGWKLWQLPRTAVQWRPCCLAHGQFRTEHILLLLGFWAPWFERTARRLEPALRLAGVSIDEEGEPADRLPVFPPLCTEAT